MIAAVSTVAVIAGAVAFAIVMLMSDVSGAAALVCALVAAQSAACIAALLVAEVAYRRDEPTNEDSDIDNN